MAAPVFLDITKIVRDLFEKGFHKDKLKIDIKTKANPGIEFSFGGIQDLLTKNVVGLLEAKYKFKEQGITFIESWNTNNLLGTEVYLEDYCQGVKVSCETYFVPVTRGKSSEEEQISGSRGRKFWTYSDKSMRLKAQYKNALGQINIESDFKSAAKPVFRTGVSVNYNGFFVGCGGIFDHNNNRIKERVVGGGYASPEGDISALLTLTEFNVLSSTTFCRITRFLETGLVASSSLDGATREIGVACKFVVDDDLTVKLKFTPKAELGVGIRQRLNKSATIYFSALINSANALLSGALHMGFCLEFTA